MSGTHGIKKSHKHSQRHAGTEKHVTKPKHQPDKANAEHIKKAILKRAKVSRDDEKNNAEGHHASVVKAHPNRRRPITHKDVVQNPA